MQDFKVIYNILKTINVVAGDDTFPIVDYIKKQGEQIGENRLAGLLEMMVDEGYVKGIVVRRYLSSPTPIVYYESPRLTMKGLEYLEENSLMKKAARIAQGIVDVVK